MWINFTRAKERFFVQDKRVSRSSIKRTYNRLFAVTQITRKQSIVKKKIDGTELSSVVLFRRECILRGIQISHGNAPQIMGLSIPKGFRLLALYQTTRPSNKYLVFCQPRPPLPYSHIVALHPQERSTLLIQSATGLKCWPHSCRNTSAVPIGRTKSTTN